MLADGATGTNYFALGLETGDAPELWNIDHPEQVREVHRGFVEAGADIILTNSFGGTRQRLKLHAAQDRVTEFNRRAAELAREVADAARREIVVAGSMGPTGDILEPIGALSVEDAAAAFAEQGQALAAGGCDVLWLETLSSVEELSAAVRGAGATGLPIVCTLSFDTQGRTMMGVTLAEVTRLVHGLVPRPVAFGGNCGTGPSELMAVMVNMARSANPGEVLVAKSNCGVPAFIEGEIAYSGTPELMAEYACLARNAGARIIGGCCGTTADHLRAMHEALEASAKGAPPDLKRIVAELGEISSGAEKLGELTPRSESESAGRGRRRGRRRGERQ